MYMYMSLNAFVYLKSGWLTLEYQFTSLKVENYNCTLKASNKHSNDTFLRTF